jgi:hypothetical protein
MDCDDVENGDFIQFLSEPERSTDPKRFDGLLLKNVMEDGTASALKVQLGTDGKFRPLIPKDRRAYRFALAPEMDRGEHWTAKDISDHRTKLVEEKKDRARARETVMNAKAKKRKAEQEAARFGQYNKTAKAKAAQRALKQAKADLEKAQSAVVASDSEHDDDIIDDSLLRDKKRVRRV